MNEAVGWIVLLIGLGGLVAIGGAWSLWGTHRTAGRRHIQGPFGFDPRVRPGEDGFKYEDLHTPIDWEIHYEIQTRTGAEQIGTFVLTTRKVWVYTGDQPTGVRIIGARPPGGHVAPGGQWLPGHKVGGHKKRKNAEPTESQGVFSSFATNDRPTPPDPTHFHAPGEWGAHDPSGFGHRYPEPSASYERTERETFGRAGEDYRGGGGESGGGGSTASWGDDTGGGNDSYPSAY